jgi:pimeloyl-ACP methyl ester carboxylesterase
MYTVTSKDGTTIAFDQSGSGSAVILVDGALGHRNPDEQDALSALLSKHFTVINYDRRGRGDSTDTAPYAPEREIEDIEALIDSVGGSASLYGISSGAVLALEAANNLGPKVQKLALYEPPFIIDDSRPPLPTDYVEQINRSSEAGRPGDAVEVFMTQAILLPSEYLEPMRQSPSWAGMESVAHTLAYDGTIVRDFMQGHPLPTDRWTSVTCPALVMSGENSEPFFHDAGQSLASLLPQATYQVVAGQDHNLDPQAIAPLLEQFFAS